MYLSFSTCAWNFFLSVRSNLSALLSFFFLYLYLWQSTVLARRKSRTYKDNVLASETKSICLSLPCLILFHSLKNEFASFSGRIKSI